MNSDFLPPKRSWPRKFRCAFQGVATGIRGQSSFFVHLSSAALVVIAAVLLGVTWVQWCLLVLCITVVLAAEMMNSALERLAKSIDRSENNHVAAALDIASGAVLMAAIGAAVVGTIVFVVRIGQLGDWWPL
jgi:diacylglycerol kinase